MSSPLRASVSLRRAAHRARLAVSALALALCSVASAQSPAPTELPLDDEGSALTVPAGFASLPPSERAGVGVRAGYTRAGAGVLLVLASPVAFAHERLDESTRAVLRAGDGFSFTDRVERFSVLGFSVEGLRGEATLDGGHRAVRFAVPVPLAAAPVVLSATGSLSDEAALRAALVSALASARGRTSLMRPWQRALATAAGLGLTVALPLSLLYGALAVSLFRRLDGRWRRARGSVLTLAGLGWIAVGAWAFTGHGFGPRGLGVLLVALGVALGGHGAGMARRG